MRSRGGREVAPPAVRGSRAAGATRRRFLAASGAAVLGAVAGCAGRGADRASDDVDVVAGAGGRLRFEPETLTVPAGSVVTWGFDSAGHNVSGRPGDSDAVELPDGADPYASYGPDASPLDTVSPGDTYEHRLSVPGTYVYSCIPHESSGMLGRLEVEA